MKNDMLDRLFSKLGEKIDILEGKDNFTFFKNGKSFTIAKDCLNRVQGAGLCVKVEFLADNSVKMHPVTDEIWLTDYIIPSIRKVLL